MSIEHNVPEVLRLLETAIDQQQAAFATDVKGVLVQTLTDIQKASPVDTGRFRASSFLEADSPSQSVVAAPEARKKRKGPKGTSSMRQEAARRLEEAIQKLESAIGRKITGQRSIFISNNLPYAMSLELGSSKQAPSGVFRVARQRAESNIAKLGGKWK